jgi:hypothetical protein
MKIHVLISAFLLGTIALAQGQTNSVPEAPAAGVAKDPNMNADSSVTLSPGTLPEVVAEVERRVPYWMETAGSTTRIMPNIVYGPGTHEAIIPTPMRLRQVSPVQALALVAAAAGCSLETIFSPAEEIAESQAHGGSSKRFSIIGYRIVLASDSTRHTYSAQQNDSTVPISARYDYDSGRYDLGQARVRDHLRKLIDAENAGPVVGVGLALSKKDGGVVVREIIPGSPASLSSTIQPGNRILSVAEAGKQDVEVTGLELEKVVQMIRGEPGTIVKITFAADAEKGMKQHVVSLMRARLPALAQETEIPRVRVLGPRTGFADNPNANIPVSSGFATPVDATSSAPNNAPFVRVFALGSVMRGSAVENKEKEENLIKLIEDALEVGGVATPTRKLSFHTQSRTLIFMGTVREHAVVEQVIKALKENEMQEATPVRR